MTLLDLYKLLKKSLWLVIGLPVLCAAVCAGVLLATPAEFSAKATINASTEVAGVNAFATEAAEAQSKGGIKVTSAANTSTRVITLTAEGGTREQVITAVNRAANAAYLNAFNRYNVSGDNLNVTVALTVSFAKTATDISPSVPKTTGIAFVAGLFVAVCIVVVRDMMRGRIHSVRDLEEDMELRVLGRIPRAGQQESALSREQLFANVRFAAGEHASVCVLAADDEGLSAQACTELAEAAQQADRTVLVIDADLHGASPLAAQLEEAGAQGLAEVLSGNAQLTEVVRTVQGFAYVSAGNAQIAAAALLDTERLGLVLSQAALEYELVVVNVPPASVHADFTYVAHAAGATVLCVQEFTTARAVIEASMAQLDVARANVVGVIAAA